MISFAFSTETCKQKQILAYFGEHTTENCGRCNALECLPKKQVKTVQIEIKNRIVAELQNGARSLKELDQSIADYTTFEIGESIRMQLSTKELLLTNTNKLKLNI
jgi:superfamily II DNA helicase RecQ